MSANTNIEWTDRTWSVTRGCSVVSPGCHQCYAMKMAHRFSKPGMPFAKLTKATSSGPQWTGAVRSLPNALLEPLSWKKPQRVFVNSMSDLFHEDVPDAFIDQVFAVMALATRHTFQILTKRADRMRAYMSDPETPGRVDKMKAVILAGRLHEVSAPERIAPIAGWPGYLITSKGRVLSDRVPRSGDIDEDQRHELKPSHGQQGHARVMLQVEGRIERLLVHRLVLEHFDRPAAVDEQGRHLDGNPTNNALWNLAWGGQTDNWDDSKRHGTRRRYSKLTPEQVTEIKARVEAGESAYSIAPHFGVSDTQIRNIAKGRQWQPEHKPEWPLPSVWLGVSVEDQQRADERIPLLLQTPAAVRFISAEPLLGPVNLEAVPIPAPGADVYGLRGVTQPLTEKDAEPDDWKYWTRHAAKLGWVIVGGESGPGARPCDVAWVRSIVQQCQAAGVPVFVKQMGSCLTGVNLDGPPYSSPPRREGFLILWTCREKNTFGLCDRKGGDPVDWPDDLRVRQFPGSAGKSGSAQ